MTTTSMMPAAADPVSFADLNRGRPADSIGDSRAAWRLALDSAWRRKMDEVITLSKASYGLTSDTDGSLPDRGVRVSSRLRARTESAYDDLAAIEDAIARVDDGTYGMCAGCDQAMTDEWLAEKPEGRYCPDCSLRLVSWRQSDLPEVPRSTRVKRRRPKSGSGVRRRPNRQGRLASVG
jgi:DnaK suppressor protein